MEVRTPDPPHLPKHVPAKNAPDFTFPNKDTPKTRPVLHPIRRRGVFRGVCNTPLHGYVQNLVGFGLKPSSRLFEGRMQYAPTRVRAKFDGFHISAHGHAQNPPDFRPKPSARLFEGRMQYAPTRVRAIPARFHTSAQEYAQNVPDFTLPNKDTPKSRPVLHPKRRRGVFRGICNTPLHGYVQNLTGFRREPLSRFFGGRMLLRPYTGT